MSLKVASCMKTAALEHSAKATKEAESDAAGGQAALLAKSRCDHLTDLATQLSTAANFIGKCANAAIRFDSNGKTLDEWVLGLACVMKCFFWPHVAALTSHQFGVTRWFNFQISE
jgi:hypothetical protein